MIFLKQSTAVTVKVGPFVDSTDGFSPETSLTISQADIRLSKNGGAFAQTNNATGATHDENGWYGIPLDTTDTNTLGTLKVAVNESGALPVWEEFMVLPANSYDSLVANTDTLGVTVTTNSDKTGYSVDTVNDKTGYSISGTKNTLDDLNDLNTSDIQGITIDGTKDLQEVLQDVWAIIVGNVSPSGTTTLTFEFKAPDGTTTRRTHVVDTTSGNRSQS